MKPKHFIDTQDFSKAELLELIELIRMIKTGGQGRRDAQTAAGCLAGDAV